MQLWREPRDLGYPGTPKQVGRWLSERRTRPAKTTIRRWQRSPVAATMTPPARLPVPPPKQLSRHLLRDPDELDPEAAATVARVLQDGEAAKVVGLARRFCRIVRSSCGGKCADPASMVAFDTWLAEARRCGVRVVESFVANLDQDRAAVRAGLELPWSSGQAETQHVWPGQARPPSPPFPPRSLIHQTRR